MSTTAKPPLVAQPPTPTTTTKTTGVRLSGRTWSTLDAWVTPPGYRSRAEVITEMCRVLTEASWKPGYDGIAFLEAKKKQASQTIKKPRK